MPFLLVTGHPACGKTTIVEKIVDHFKKKGKECVVVRDDDYASFNRSDYNDITKEKDMRSYLRSGVQRHLGKNTIVICDGLNYIKGYRYELFLTGKVCKTTYAVLQCTAEESTCAWLNSQKAEDARYTPEKIPELLMRYEKPDARNRWDSPLFEVKIGKAERSLDSEDIPEDMSVDLEYPSPRFAKIPLDDIYEWLCNGVCLKENQSTQVVPMAPDNYLHVLDKVTKEVVDAVLVGQSMTAPGPAIVVPQALDDANKVNFTRTRSMPELTRLRRQFISFTKSHPVADQAKIASLFIDFLNSNNR